ncbi:hypothetical protein BcerKBAB4_5354 (plasmid) [Bacillus mycoides KBAB4]|uniref:Uncharacterized protein n=2 Tax=Bacillus mycoides TaxID=1405 RepID=A9VVN3_BACMK|nr:hypothetical protein BcerKBAB4_5354 [Bacillus mycoides KBAB4]
MMSDHKFNVGDSAIINESFGLAEVHDGDVFDDYVDIINYVRGDVVDILKIINVPQPSESHPVLAVIYNPKIRDATVVSVEFLNPVKGTAWLGGPNMKIQGGIINAGHLSGSTKISF